MSGTGMNQMKMLQSPLPIDRVAARVVKKAKPEEIWRPLPKFDDNMVRSENFIPVTNLPWATLNSNPELASVPGKRRGRMVVCGYAADQGPYKGNPAKWVVRCDCGNYEQRTRILRWLGTEATDMCKECQVRATRTRGEFSSREKPYRATVAQNVHDRI